MLSCGGGGLSSFSDQRGFQTFAESELVLCRPAASAAAGGEERSKTSRPSTMAFPMRPVCVNHGSCSIASRRLAIPCWPDRPVRPSMQLLDAKAFPARFVRPMPDWRWRTAMVKILCPCPIRSGSRLSQKSELISRRPAASAGDERVPPFVPKHQARRHYDGVPPFQVCLSAQHHEHCQQCFCESKAACTKFSSSSVVSIQHLPIERTTFKRKTDDLKVLPQTKNHETRRSSPPPDSHISTTANDQKPHVHSLLSGSMSALPDNQSPSNRWHMRDHASSLLSSHEEPLYLQSSAIGPVNIPALLFCSR